MTFLEKKMNERMQLDAVYINSVEAFDKISHNILSRHFFDTAVGVNLFRWRESYMSDRVQFGLCGWV